MRKSIREIEELGFDRLESIASDESIRVPEGLEDRLRSTLTAAALGSAAKSRSRGKKVFRTAALTLSAAAIAAAVAVPRAIYPRDTFSDPRLAIAEVQRTLLSVGSKLDKGLSIARKGDDSVRKPLRQLQEINDKLTQKD